MTYTKTELLDACAAKDARILQLEAVIRKALELMIPTQHEEIVKLLADALKAGPK